MDRLIEFTEAKNLCQGILTDAGTEHLEPTGVVGHFGGNKVDSHSGDEHDIVDAVILDLCEEAWIHLHGLGNRRIDVRELVDPDPTVRDFIEFLTNDTDIDAGHQFRTVAQVPDCFGAGSRGNRLHIRQSHIADRIQERKRPPLCRVLRAALKTGFIQPGLHLKAVCPGRLLVNPGQLDGICQ